MSDGHKALTTAENLEVKTHQTAQKLVPTRIEGEAAASSYVLTSNITELCLLTSFRGKPSRGISREPCITAILQALAALYVHRETTLHLPVIKCPCSEYGNGESSLE